jgi:hypothetical protein
VISNYDRVVTILPILTTFRTQYRTYKIKVVPFSLTNSPATYQYYINNILFDYLDNFCTAYLNNILIYSENELEYKAQVKKVLECLRKAGLQTNIKKSKFSIKRTKYLGFIISTEGIEVDLEKVAVIQNWQLSTTVKRVQSFLGSCNFYRRFIKEYRRIARPLNRLTRKGILFVFDQVCQEAFKKLKYCLILLPILGYYNPEAESILETDTSNKVVAGIFS